MAERKVRVRFAPSPTGALHIGGVRTALYNYLFARQHGGELVFRIEDTDSHRFVPGAEEYIIESFKWLGIKFDEGVSFGGNYGPYRQSERRDIYKKYVKQLLDNGKAYYAADVDANQVVNFQQFSENKIPANTGAIIKGEVNAEVSYTILGADVDFSAENLLHGTNTTETITADDDYNAAVKSIVVQSVTRALNSISDASPAASQGSETNGSYSISMTYLNAGQSLYFLRNELKELGLKRQVYGALELYDTEE